MPTTLYIAQGEVFSNQCKNHTLSNVRVESVEREVKWEKGLGVEAKLHKYHSLWVNTLLFVLH